MIRVCGYACIQQLTNVPLMLPLRFLYILRKTIEGYLDLFSSLTFNTIKTKLFIHAFHSSRYLQSK